MYRRMTVDELTQNLAEVLEGVRRGDHVTIWKDGHPIAALDPTVEIVAEEPSAPMQRLGDYQPPPLPEPIDFDPLEYLMDDRKKGRR